MVAWGRMGAAGRGAEWGADVCGELQQQCDLVGTWKGATYIKGHRPWLGVTSTGVGLHMGLCDMTPKHKTHWCCAATSGVALADGHVPQTTDWHMCILGDSGQAAARGHRHVGHAEVCFVRLCTALLGVLGVEALCELLL